MYQVNGRRQVPANAQTARPVNGQQKAEAVNVPMIAKQDIGAKTVQKLNAWPVRGLLRDKVLVHNALPVHSQRRLVQNQMLARTVRPVNGRMREEVRHVRITVRQDTGVKMAQESNAVPVHGR